MKNKKHKIDKDGRKKILLLYTASAIALLAFSASTAYTQTDSPDYVPDTTGQTEAIPLDTATIELKDKRFTIIEYENSMTVDREDLETGEKKRILDLGGAGCETDPANYRFRGHWSGFEVGVNNFMSSGYSFDPPAGYDYMDMKFWRSWNVNFNFAQLSIPLGRRGGLVTGMGIELNSYYFKNGNSIQLNETSGEIEERILEDTYDVKKSKLKTTYLTMPLLLETQLGRRHPNRYFYISTGVIGGYKISHSLKVKHRVEETNQKLIERRTNLNINPWRAAVTLRWGSKAEDNSSSGWYINYYFTQLFEEGMGPELYPWSVGFRLDF